MQFPASDPCLPSHLGLPPAFTHLPSRPGSFSSPLRSSWTIHAFSSAFREHPLRGSSRARRTVCPHEANTQRVNTGLPTVIAVGVKCEGLKQEEGVADDLASVCVCVCVCVCRWVCCFLWLPSRMTTNPGLETTELYSLTVLELKF